MPQQNCHHQFSRPSLVWMLLFVLEVGYSQPQQEEYTHSASSYFTTDHLYEDEQGQSGFIPGMGSIKYLESKVILKYIIRSHKRTDLLRVSVLGGSFLKNHTTSGWGP